MTAPSLYWLRQDLRLADNPALSAAAAQGPVIFLHVLEDQSPGEWRMGGATRWWLHHSLADLGQRIEVVPRIGAVHVLDGVAPEVHVAGQVPDCAHQGALFFRQFQPLRAHLVPLD